MLHKPAEQTFVSQEICLIIIRDDDDDDCTIIMIMYLATSVGIATDYGLDGPGSNPGEDEIFRPSRPTLGPTQPPVKWVPGLSRG